MDATPESAKPREKSGSMSAAVLGTITAEVVETGEGHYQRGSNLLSCSRRTEPSPEMAERKGRRRRAELMICPSETSATLKDGSE